MADERDQGPIVKAEERVENASPTARWLALAGEVHTQLVAGAEEAMGCTLGMSNWAPETVAVRLLLRSCRNLEGVLLLCHQRLVVESRVLARCLMESSFGVAALLSKPDVYLQMLQDDAAASRRRQGKFILERMSDSPGDKDRLKQVIESMDKRLNVISPIRVAELGSMLLQYLGYQRFSDDSAHATANSLHHHVRLDHDETWTYECERGTDSEIASTIHYALLASLAVGIGVTEKVGANAANRKLFELSERWRDMPPAETI